MSKKTIGKAKCEEAPIPGGLVLGERQKTLRRNAFRGDASFDFVEVPEGVERIGDDAFAECPNLRSVVIPANVKSIGNGAFSGCTSLRSVVIEGECEIWPNAFTNCPALKKVKIAGVIHQIEPDPTPLMGWFGARKSGKSGVGRS